MSFHYIQLSTLGCVTWPSIFTFTQATLNQTITNYLQFHKPRTSWIHNGALAYSNGYDNISQFTHCPSEWCVTRNKAIRLFFLYGSKDSGYFSLPPHTPEVLPAPVALTILHLNHRYIKHAAPILSVYVMMQTFMWCFTSFGQYQNVKRNYHHNIFMTNWAAMETAGIVTLSPSIH